MTVVILCFCFFFFFFFKQKTAYEIRNCDWSSDVCSSDLEDIDALRVIIGNDLITWAMHATTKLSVKDYGDRQIRHRIAKYVDRHRAKVEKYGFIME